MKNEKLRTQSGTQLKLQKTQIGILVKCLHEASFSELMQLSKRTNRTKFRNDIMNPLLKQQLIEHTIPEKPNSRLQKYRLTEKGRLFIEHENLMTDNSKEENSYE